MSLFSSQTLSVTQLNEYIKGLVSDDLLLKGLSLRGEISGFKRHSSGHLYFSVKDEGALIRCVMFRQSAMLLRIAPRDGLRVVLSGYVSFYTRDGALQFYCEGMRADGVGALYQAFEELKEKLKAEGLFDAAGKRALPPLPRRLAVVTSPTGAAVRDILRVAKRRNPALDIVVVPAQVQGDGAAKSIVEALRVAATLSRVDVAIVARGGGSIEDLWCFNEEIVARAIATCPVPVISGVGHETDFTIADFVADVRAATPSQAAEIAVPDAAFMLERKQRAQQRLGEAMLRQLRSSAERLARAAGSRVLARPEGFFLPAAERAQALSRRLTAQGVAAVNMRILRLDAMRMRLDALSPKGVLERGYSIVLSDTGKAITGPDGVKPGDRLHIRMARGDMNARREV